MSYAKCFLNFQIEGGEIKKWLILSTRVDYVEHNRQAFPSSITKFTSIEGRCHGGYRQKKRR